MLAADRPAFVAAGRLHVIPHTVTVLRGSACGFPPEESRGPNGEKLDGR